jgi:hypothetical protein
VSEIIVAHVRDGIPGVYIGRPMRGRAGSVLGNPFRISAESARAGAIADYEGWLRKRMRDVDSVQARELDRLARILERDGRFVLLCWCSPLPCHGDVVAKIIRERLA